ncbi:MAG TPA: serine/threonine-protein kinase, partial [Xanthomonadales bacterium]|nr:serine/threonine-protein kinase [Xanthomonadales bacterium]
MSGGDDTGSFGRLRELFDRIAELDPVLREAVIHSACGDDAAMERDLRSLLEAHDREAGRTGETRVRILDEGHAVLTGAAEPGERIGPFVLREPIGRGGMGVVYRAERVDGAVRQQVAVKILQRMHLDEAGVRRFAQERDIVAQLSHPGIARLFDAGTTREGFPYYAMELVDGKSITTWCEQRRLPVAERLELFLKVCDAVRFAHANLVLHRDIKPANVLVDAAGTPKLIDFGIAKPMASLDDTATGLQLFSPSNAAPEQIRGERCGVACDVYQLGTLLYEMLTGKTVLGDTTTPGEIEATILHRVPARPSEKVADTTTAKLLRGDLDSIVLRALRKEPDQRYASVEQLAADVRRFQRHEPVAARAGDRTYRLRKFVERHAKGIAAAGAAALLTIAFVATLLVQAQRLERERDAARLDRNRSQAISRFLTDVFTAADPGQTLSRDTVIGEVLDRGRERLLTDLHDEPALRVPLLGVLAEVYSVLGDNETAIAMANEATRLLESGAQVSDRDR